MTASADREERTAESKKKELDERILRIAAAIGRHLAREHLAKNPGSCDSPGVCNTPLEDPQV